jgi:Radical SAM superfamily
MMPRFARRVLPVIDHSYLLRGARLLGGFVAGRPIHAIIQVSNRCNLTCSFCSFWANPARPEHELTLADLQTVSDKLAEAGSLVVSIEGGEPLLRPDAVELVAAFARHHHPILFTNSWRASSGMPGSIPSGSPSTMQMPRATIATAANRVRSTPLVAPSISCATAPRRDRARCS